MNLIQEKIHLPQEIIDLVKNLPYKNGVLGESKNCDRVLGLIWFIHERECIIKEKGVNVSFSNLKNVFRKPSSIAVIKKVLFDHNILQYYSESYSAGNFSKSYTLGCALDNISWKQNMEITVPVLRKKYDGYLSYLSIDKEMALSILDTLNMKDHTRTVFRSMIKSFHTKYSIGKTGRQFGVWNMIPSRCRRALRIYNEETCEWDIVNCQPLLLAGISGDKAFMDITMKGLFYEHLCGHLRIDRSAAKELFVKWLGGHKRTGLDAFMQENYPVAFNFRKSLEDVQSGDTIRLLQQLESSIVLPICEATGAASIHDGLRVPLSKKDEIPHLLTEAFSKFGITPSLKLETP